MQSYPKFPNVPVKVEQVVAGGGLDMISPPGYAKPGTVRFAINYEQEFGGGYRRVGGFERFDGQPSPHLAVYVVLEASAGFTASLGDTVTGSTSAATGKVVWISVDAKQIGLTKVVGGPGPFTLEELTVSAVPVGTVTDNEPDLDGFTDNEIAHAAADEYRADIAKPDGTGPILGVAVLKDEVYCWRNVANALVTYKATSAGWVVVDLYSQVSFTAGSAAYADGSTLTQGGASATVKRAVVESGTWAAGTAAGRLIIDPIAGTFAAGAATGGGAATLSGAAAQISQLAGGQVRSVVANFTASLDTQRLYCCDGTNLEWEFDGDVIVPITTGMGSIRAATVFAHNNHLFYAYRWSLQHSSIGDPYDWNPLTGASELSAGDTITNLVAVSGTETSAALLVLCKDSAVVLYGVDADSWKIMRVSDQAGAQAGSAFEVAGGVLAFDRDGWRRFRPTDTFGNFGYESESRSIEPLVRNAAVKCAVLSKNKSIYRCFFSDGLFMTATPFGKGFAWMPCDYGRTIECAVGAEVDGLYRIFMGDADGWVLEADVGRSFDGDEVQAGLRFSSQTQGGEAVEKQYRHVEIKTEAESAFELAVGAEYSDSDPEGAGVTASSMQDFKRAYGDGLFWDFESWDRAYWDTSLVNRVRYSIHGKGRSISVLLSSLAEDEMPHTIKTMTVFYTPRRIAR